MREGITEGQSFIFLADVFTDEWQIISVNPEQYGNVRITAHRAESKLGQQNFYNEVHGRSYANSLSRKAFNLKIEQLTQYNDGSFNSHNGESN